MLLSRGAWIETPAREYGLRTCRLTRSVIETRSGLTPQYWTLCYDSLSFRITIKKHLVKLTRGHVFQTAMHASLVVILHVFADYGVDIEEALKLVQPIAFLLQDGMKCLDVSVHN